MERVAILFGSSSGNTEAIAENIARKLGPGITRIFNVSDFQVSELADYRNLILGVSTWGIGELQDDWTAFLPELTRSDLKGKTIALFGLGDAESYPDSFVDGMGIIYDAIRDKGCNIVGTVDTEGYLFDHSKAVYEGKFIGLPLDEDNEGEFTESRLEKWLADITVQFV
jgi:flavodoxin I